MAIRRLKPDSFLVQPGVQNTPVPAYPRAHDLRYFTEPAGSWLALLQPFGKYGAFAMVGGLAGL